MLRTATRWILLLGSVTFLVYVPYRAAYRSVFNEIRSHAMGVATAMAAALDPEDLRVISTAQDMDSPEFRRVSAYLGSVVAQSPDVRYAYTMRRSVLEDASPADFMYIVDSPAHDKDGDGFISPEEESEPPGTLYDASHLPRMVEAWDHPTADDKVSPDPPYPDLLSGYAPIRDATGQTVAILGVDILASTVARKILLLRLTSLGAWGMLCGLGTAALLLFDAKSRALRTVQALSASLQESNRILQSANEELARNNKRFEQELELARRVQHNFLPQVFPFAGKLRFGQLYLSCEILGGDLFDAFRLDDRRVGIYMADVSGHGVSAALVAGLLKMSVETLRVQANLQDPQAVPELLRPELLLSLLNRTLSDSLPQSTFITFSYAVIDTEARSLVLASAGHLPPIHYQARKSSAAYWDIPGAHPIGIFPLSDYTESSRRLEPGDKIVFFTDGITEARDPETDGDLFGQERLLQIIQEAGPLEPEQLIRAVKQAVDAHIHHKPIQDDFSILVVQLLD